MSYKHNFTFTSFIKNEVVFPENLEQLTKYLKSKHTIIGNLRSYGDTCVGKNSKHISLKNFNKIINFDKKNELIEVQSGLMLKDFFNYIVKKNFILECMPGCKFVTIGGMIANNIHGKLIIDNSLSKKIVSIKLIGNNYKIIECSRNKNKKLFDLTIGGKGLTGPILSAKIRVTKLPSKTIYQETYYFDSKRSFIKYLKELKKFKYSVTWLNFTKKNFEGMILCGKYIKKKKYSNSGDFNLPKILIYLISLISTNKLFIKFFNFIFKNKNFFLPKKFIALNDYFFPQNKILNWNKVYKKNGFIQLHFYLSSNQINLVDEIKNELLSNEIYSNLAVIKFHENIKNNKISKLSLSLDVPLNNNKIIIILNKFVKKHNLNVNLGKDIILKKPNKKIYLNNEILMKKSKKFIMKNVTSNFFERLKNAY